MPTKCITTAQIALPFLLPEPPAVVDGIAGQMDIVAAVFEAERTAPQPCSTCRTGCDCDGRNGDVTCGHYACWGRAAEGVSRCAGVDYEKARRDVLAAPRAQEQIKAARRRGSDVLDRVTARLLTDAGLSA